jgi:hypothetical protein
VCKQGGFFSSSGIPNSILKSKSRPPCSSGLFSLNSMTSSFLNCVGVSWVTEGAGLRLPEASSRSTVAAWIMSKTLLCSNIHLNCPLVPNDTLSGPFSPSTFWGNKGTQVLRGYQYDYHSQSNSRGRLHIMTLKRLLHKLTSQSKLLSSSAVSLTSANGWFHRYLIYASTFLLETFWL